jgi:hypothetical protein
MDLDVQKSGWARVEASGSFVQRLVEPRRDLADLPLRCPRPVVDDERGVVKPKRRAMEKGEQETGFHRLTCNRGK